MGIRERIVKYVRFKGKGIQSMYADNPYIATWEVCNTSYMNSNVVLDLVSGTASHGSLVFLQEETFPENYRVIAAGFVKRVYGPPDVRLFNLSSGAHAIYDDPSSINIQFYSEENQTLSIQDFKVHYSVLFMGQRIQETTEENDYIGIPIP